MPTLADAAWEVSENAAAGSIVGRLVASDADMPLDLVFEINSGNELGHFVVNSFTGDVAVADGADIDFENVREYVLTCVVTDKGRLEDTTPQSDSSTVVITVLNVNDVSISSFEGALPHRTIGGEVVTLSGSNFGPVPGSAAEEANPGDVTIAVTYGANGNEYTAECELSDGRGNRAIDCVTSAGVGQGLVWVVTITAPGISGDNTTSSVTTSYHAPTISAISESSIGMSSAGGSAVTFTGLDFGPVISSVSVEYGHLLASDAGASVSPHGQFQPVTLSAVGCQFEADVDGQQQVSCDTVPGAGNNLLWRITVGGQSSAPMAVLFDAEDGSMSVEAVTGVVAEGGAIDIGARSASRYGTPVVSAVVPPATMGGLLDTRGGEEVSLVGTNFGPSGTETRYGLRVFYGPTSAPRRFEAASCRLGEGDKEHKLVMCTTAVGVGRDHVWEVEVGAQSSSDATPAVAANMTAYAAPEVHSVGGVGASDANTRGGQVLVLQGNYFGAPEVVESDMLHVSYGPSGDRFEAASCRIENDHTMIQCVTAPGTGRDHSWYITIDGQQSVLFPAMTSYAAPIVSFYSGNGSTDAVTPGGQEVFVHGFNFGPAALGNTINATYGMNGTELVAQDCEIVVDHEKLRCMTQDGAGAGHTWLVTVDGQMSTTPTTDYGEPAVFNITGPGSVEGSVYGGEEVLIHGENFGPPERQGAYLERVSYGPTGYEYTAVGCEVVSHYLLRCTTAPGVGRNLRWVVRVEGQESGPSEATTSYARPVITSTDLQELPATETVGGYIVTLNGTNMGDPEHIIVMVEVEGVGSAPLLLRQNPADPTLVQYIPGGSTSTNEDGRMQQHVDMVKFRLPAGRGKGKAVRVVTLARGMPGATMVKSAMQQYGYDDPLIFRTVVKELFPSDLPEEDRNSTLFHDILSSGHVFVDVTLFGRSFGRTFQPSADSSVTVYVAMPAEDGATDAEVNTTVVNYWEYTHGMIRFVMPRKGEAWIEITSTGVDGTVYTQISNRQSFDFFSPFVAARTGPNGEPLPDPVVSTNGTSWISVEGRNLWAEGIPTAVTIGGINGGSKLNDERVETGWLLDSSGEIVDASTGAANQFVRVQVPAWQGQDVPVIVFKKFANGNAPGSLPFMVDFQPPTMDSMQGSQGVVMNEATQQVARRSQEEGTQPTIYARTDGSTRVRFTGYDFGVAGARIDMVGLGSFTDCEQGQTYVECTAPLGQGPGLGESFSIQAVIPSLRCRPDNVKNVSGTPIPVWDECDQYVDLGLDAATISRPVEFRYESPNVWVVSQGLPTSGGQLVLQGVNFGSPVLAAAAPANKPVITLSHPRRPAETLVCESDVPTVPGNGAVESVTCELPANTGSEWRVDMSVGGQPLMVQPSNASFAYAEPVITSISNSTGTTAGGYLVTLYGTSMGGEDFMERLTVRVRASNDPGDASETGVLVPDANSPSGPAIVSASHTHVTFEMPEGQGSKVISLVVDGQVSNTVPFTYALPHIISSSPSLVPTRGGAELTLFGESLGSSMGEIEVVLPIRSRTLYPNKFNDTILGDAVEYSLNESRTIVCTDNELSPCRILEHTHTSITFRSPIGFGRDNEMRLLLGAPVDQTPVSSNTVPLHYAPPHIIAVVPNQPSAAGDEIIIRGENFGEEPMYAHVELNGLACESTEWRQERGQRPMIVCHSREDAVGRKDLTLDVAFQRVTAYSNMTYMESECVYGYYGQAEYNSTRHKTLVNEFCVECPVGTECEGGEEEPVSLAGWYVMRGAAPSECHSRRTHRDWCVNPAPCEPPEACLGNNECAVGYADKAPMYRCSSCALGYYKRAGLCKECPDNAWMLMVGFGVMAIVGAAVGYQLNKRGASLAFLNIGVDYFQVLALLGKTRVSWPVAIEELLHWLSMFQFSLDITVPECSLPDLQYTTKWFAIEGLPLGILALMLLVHALQILRKCIMGRTKNLTRHVPVMVGACITMFYFLFTYLARTVFDVFACSPTTPDDGKLYLEVVFEECGKPGGIQMTLLPFAFIAFALYVVGYPALLGWVLWRYKFQIQQDQLLRAFETGQTRLTNPYAYEIRKMYHRAYFHFRPDRFYWITAILARKFGVAITALMFTKNPAFQLSMALLILFLAFSAHLKFLPYMAPSDHAAVVKEHERKVLDGDTLHCQLDGIMREVEARSRKKGDTTSMEAKRRVAMQRLNSGVLFFWNYNSVEAVLLFCAVLVCLGGVMFESGRFDSDAFAAQRDAVAWVIILIIVGSIVYFCAVLFTEVYLLLGGKCPSRFNKAMAGDVEATKLPSSALNTGISAQMNPMFLVGAGGASTTVDMDTLMAMKDAPDAAQWASIKKNVEGMRETVTDLRSELERLKRESVLGRTGAGSAGGLGMARSALSRVASRREFKPRMADVPGAAVTTATAAPRAKKGSPVARTSGHRRQKRRSLVLG
jgi:hypothetical protein